MIETDEVLYSRFLTERNEDAFRILLDRHGEFRVVFADSAAPGGSQRVVKSSQVIHPFTLKSLFSLRCMLFIRSFAQASE